MRFLAIVLASGLIAAPAMAQGCDVSAAGKIGEVLAFQEKAGGPVTITWAVERKEGVGEETDNFARPALELDFREAAVGALKPSRAIVSVTRVSAPDVGKAPALSQVSIRATPSGAAAVTWKADHPLDGEKELAGRLAEAWPAGLVIDLLVAGKVVASATFDLKGRPEMETTAAGLLEKCA